MDVEEQARAISAFGGKVFHGLFQSSHNSSVAVSPLALGMVLMAATSGAEGETKRELLDTFRISTLDLESCQSLIRYVLPNQPKTITIVLHSQSMASSSGDFSIVITIIYT
jgi:serine protease inhibitor